MDSQTAASRGSIISTSGSTATPEPTLIFTLPPELHNHLFGFLDPLAAACFGLTCKRFYKIHRSFNGTVQLDTKTPDDESARPLHEFLEGWIGEGLSDDVRVLIIYDGVQNKFRDMGDIVESHGKRITAASAKMEQIANEIEGIQRQIEELVSSALPVPGYINEQRQEKMKVFQEEIEKMEFGQASFEYAMGKLNRVLRDARAKFIGGKAVVEPGELDDEEVNGAASLAELMQNSL